MARHKSNTAVTSTEIPNVRLTLPFLSARLMAGLKLPTLFQGGLFLSAQSSILTAISSIFPRWMTSLWNTTAQGRLRVFFSCLDIFYEWQRISFSPLIFQIPFFVSVFCDVEEKTGFYPLSFSFSFGKTTLNNSIVAHFLSPDFSVVVPAAREEEEKKGKQKSLRKKIPQKFCGE